MRRQERYRASGVRGLWLLRQPGFPITKDLPAVCIGGDLSDGFIALLPRSRHMRASHRSLPEVWAQAFPMDGFLQAAFERRFQYGLKPDHAADLSIWTGNMDCWSCGCETKIIRQVQLSVLGQQFGLGIAEVERYGVLDSLVPHLSSIPGIGIIKRRYSRTMESNYASNGCAHCDALIGQHFEHQAERDNVPVMTLQVPVSVGWKAAMD